MNRAYHIAFLARRYRLLSERPEYLTANRAELIDRMLNAQVAVGDFDRTLILQTSELDRLCAHAVRTLAHHTPAAVLDVLGVLHPDRLAAMYYALSVSRQESVRRDPAWAYQIERVPPDTEAVVAEVAGWAEGTQQIRASLARLDAQAPSEARKDAERWDRSMLRHEVGLPVMLTDAERKLIAESDEQTEQVLAMTDVFLDEISALDSSDDEAFEAACARAIKRCSPSP